MSVDKVSISRLNELHPLIRQSAIRAYTKACAITPVGVHPFITECYRSFERSNQIYAQGRTKAGKIVSNAKGGQSFHNFRLALDFVNLVNGKALWRVDENWMKVVQCFKEEGFEWGGDWRFKDYPHFQKDFGYTTSQLLAMHTKKDFIEGNKFLNLNV